MDHRVAAIALGVIIGTLTRWLLLKVDYRAYPSYPHGYLDHLALGLVAAFLGAVAVPAIVAHEYTAATFLALAATQFREVRKIEREKLAALDDWELVPRGSPYIEGIAQAFETRNYLVMLVALATGLVAEFGGLIPGTLVGLAGAILSNFIKSGKRLGDIARMEIVELRFEGPNLYVGDVYIMNLALEDARRKVLKWGIGVLLYPINENHRETLNNVGQRQAILHDISAILGARIDLSTPEFTPMARKNEATGVIGLYLVPADKNVRALKAAIERVPMLESARGSTLETLAGKIAKD